MEMKISEIVDRWTICRMKARLSKDVEDELATLDREIRYIVISKVFEEYPFEYLRAMMQIMEANSKIWMLEASIRMEFENDPAVDKKISLEEVGRRALLIRNFNKLRIHGKNAIDNLVRQNPDIKVDHASA